MDVQPYCRYNREEAWKRARLNRESSTWPWFKNSSCLSLAYTWLERHSKSSPDGGHTSQQLLQMCHNWVLAHFWGRPQAFHLFSTAPVRKDRLPAVNQHRAAWRHECPPFLFCRETRWRAKQRQKKQSNKSIFFDLNKYQREDVFIIIQLFIIKKHSSVAPCWSLTKRGTTASSLLWCGQEACKKKVFFR